MKNNQSIWLLIINQKFCEHVRFFGLYNCIANAIQSIESHFFPAVLQQFEPVGILCLIFLVAIGKVSADIGFKTCHVRKILFDS